MADIRNNLFIVNAPAGSGKTTYIKSSIAAHIAEHPNDSVLCITYTNRAADELSKDIKSNKVFVNTIHSFLAAYLKQYFSVPVIIRHYCDFFEQRIRERIDNVSENERVEESNRKYEEKYGKCNWEVVCANISEISYNEAPYSALYYGRLSHDDLILFAGELFRIYPSISKRLSSKYQQVFIDEYQDTNAEVLRIFYSSLRDTSSRLYLFGDRMQQIYKNYDGSFESQFAEFDNSRILNINYRSTACIIQILNKIYNDEKYKQIPSNEFPNEILDHHPRVIITSNVQTSLIEAQSETSDALTLFLLNKERFSAIGAANLFNAYGKMPRYSHGSQYTVVDVLTNIAEDNPDPLMRLMYLFLEMRQDFESQKYGAVIQAAKRNFSIFEQSAWRIKSHVEKIVLREKFEQVINTINENQTIAAILSSLKNTSLVSSAYLEKMPEDDFQELFTIPINEVSSLFNYLKSPAVSTQHGVKGESHDSVIFLAEDCKNNPVVHMYRFIDVWSRVDFSLEPFQRFYYQYDASLREIEQELGIEVRNIDSNCLKELKDTLCAQAQRICARFSDNVYFAELCYNEYQAFLRKQTIKNAQAAFNGRNVYGVLSAYKLFYVGCSRARRNLTVLLDRNKMHGDVQSQISKFKQLGFEVFEQQ